MNLINVIVIVISDYTVDKVSKYFAWQAEYTNKMSSNIFRVYKNACHFA